MAKQNDLFEVKVISLACKDEIVLCLIDLSTAVEFIEFETQFNCDLRQSNSVELHSHPKIGNVYAAKSSNAQWYRVKVVKRCQELTFECFLVDYGRNDVFHFFNFRQLPVAFDAERLPFLAITGVISNLSPFGDKVNKRGMIEQTFLKRFPVACEKFILKELDSARKVYFAPYATNVLQKCSGDLVYYTNFEKKSLQNTLVDQKLAAFSTAQEKSEFFVFADLGVEPSHFKSLIKLLQNSSERISKQLFVKHPLLNSTSKPVLDSDHAPTIDLTEPLEEISSVDSCSVNDLQTYSFRGRGRQALRSRPPAQSKQSKSTLGRGARLFNLLKDSNSPPKPASTSSPEHTKPMPDINNKKTVNKCFLSDDENVIDWSAFAGNSHSKNLGYVIKPDFHEPAEKLKKKPLDQSEMVKDSPPRLNSSNVESVIESSPALSEAFFQDDHGVENGFFTNCHNSERYDSLSKDDHSIENGVLASSSGFESSVSTDNCRFVAHEKLEIDFENLDNKHSVLINNNVLMKKFRQLLVLSESNRLDPLEPNFAPFPQHIKMYYKQRSLSVLESYCWPYIFNMWDVIGIDESTSVRMHTYAPAVLSSLINNHESLNLKNISGTGPLIIILVSSEQYAEEVDEMFRRINMNNGFPFSKFRFSIVCTSQDKSICMQLLSGCDILISTPHCLSYHLTKGFTNFSRLLYFIFDEADVLTEIPLANEIKTIVQQFRNEYHLRKNTLRHNWHLGVFSSRWKPAVDELMKITKLRNVDSHKYNVSISSKLDACIFSGVSHHPIICHDAPGKTYRISKLIEILDSSVHLNGNVVIFCDDVVRATHIQQSLHSVAISSDIVSNETSLPEIDLIERDWNSNSKRKVLVLEDIDYNRLSGFPIQTIIHYDLPQNKSVCENRLFLLALANQQLKPFMSFYLCTDLFKYDYAFLYDLFERTIPKNLIPPEIFEMKQVTRYNSEVKKSSIPFLCENLEAFGKCHTHNCKNRHTFLPEDEPGNRNEYSIYRSGFVRISIRGVFFGSGFYARVESYRQNLNEKFCNIEYPNIELDLLTNKPTVKYTQKCFRLYDLVVVRLDSVYHRARILGISSHNLHGFIETIRVELVDIGYVVDDVLFSNDVFVVPEQFRTKQFQCMKCFIANVQPLESQRLKWNPQSKRLIRENFEKRTVVAKVVFAVNNSLILENIVEKQYQPYSNTWINCGETLYQQFLHSRIAVKNPEHIPLLKEKAKNVFKAIVENVENESRTIIEQVLQTGFVGTVKITTPDAIFHHNDFYLMKESDYATLIDIKEYISLNLTSFDRLTECTKGSLCLVKYTRSNKRMPKGWYRGRILTRFIENRTCQVFFLDYGITNIVHSRQLKVFPSELYKFPSLAIRFSLNDCHPIQCDQYANSDVECLKSLMCDNLVTLSVNVTTSDSKFTSVDVVLTNIETNEKSSLNEVLVKKGVAFSSQACTRELFSPDAIGDLFYDYYTMKTILDSLAFKDRILSLLETDVQMCVIDNCLQLVKLSRKPDLISTGLEILQRCKFNAEAKRKAISCLQAKFENCIDDDTVVNILKALTFLASSQSILLSMLPSVGDHLKRTDSRQCYEALVGLLSLISPALFTDSNFRLLSKSLLDVLKTFGLVDSIMFLRYFYSVLKVFKFETEDILQAITTKLIILYCKEELSMINDKVIVLNILAILATISKPSVKLTSSAFRSHLNTELTKYPLVAFQKSCNDVLLKTNTIEQTLIPSQIRTPIIENLHFDYVKLLKQGFIIKEPLCEWADCGSYISIVIKIANVTKKNCQFSNDNFLFETVHSNIFYHLNLDLYDCIVPSKCLESYRAFELSIKLKKENENQNWPRLIMSTDKCPYIKSDLSLTISDDEREVIKTVEEIKKKVNWVEDYEPDGINDISSYSSSSYYEDSEFSSNEF